MITKVLVLNRGMITQCYHQYKHFSYQNNDNKSAYIELLQLKIFAKVFIDV